MNKYSFNPSHIVGFKYGTGPQNLREHQAADIALAKKASDLRRQVLQPGIILSSLIAAAIPLITSLVESIVKKK